MSQLQVWVCEICGEAYISDGKPSRCPFCGAYEEKLTPSKEYDDSGKWDLEMNETDKANVEHALQIEISNELFYKCASKTVKELDGQKLFKILSKVEGEHASVWKKILGLDKIDKSKKEECFVEYTKDLEDAHRRETRAIKTYKEAAAAAEHPRVKEVFEAFVKVETDHLNLSDERLA